MDWLSGRNELVVRGPRALPSAKVGSALRAFETESMFMNDVLGRFPKAARDAQGLRRTESCAVPTRRDTPRRFARDRSCSIAYAEVRNSDCECLKREVPPPYVGSYKGCVKTAGNAVCAA